VEEAIEEGQGLHRAVESITTATTTTTMMMMMMMMMMMILGLRIMNFILNPT
jgi:hypothetical protein